MRMQRVGLLLVLLLLCAGPAVRGQSPSDTLKKTEQKDWYKEVKDALTGDKGKQSAPYREASKYVVLDLGPEDSPALRFYKDTFELTWTCRRKPDAPAATDRAIKDAVVEFLKYAGSGDFNRALYEPDDIQAGTGKLAFHIVLVSPAPVDLRDIAARLGRLEETLRRLAPKQLEELREDVKKLAELRKNMRRIDEVWMVLTRLSDRVEEMLRKLPAGPGIVLPGAVFLYHPGHLAAFHCYPSTGYFFTPAYFVVRPQTTASPPRARLSAVREEVARVRGLLRPGEEPLGSPRRTAEVKRLDVTGLKAEDAEEFFWKGYALYWNGRIEEAFAQFRAAVTLRDEDARFWSYRALAEKALGDLEAARASARKAARLEGLPDAQSFGYALERVQGADRRFLTIALK
jgi:tetratricopeptide (TPR) repeat protein